MPVQDVEIKEEINIKIMLVVFITYLAYIDCKKQSISRYPLIILSILAIVSTIINILNNQSLVIPQLIGGVCIGVFMIVIGLVTKKLGIGDGVLITIMGLFLGFQSTMLMIFYALALSAIYSIFLLSIKHVRKQYRIPFIPFILLGYIGVLL